MIEDFQSIDELYKRVLPALRIKKCEFHYFGYSHIFEKDIWNYLSDVKWKMGYHLTLFDIVDDILQLKIDDFIYHKTSYIRNELGSEFL